jgi:hypothetical protein
MKKEELKCTCGKIEGLGKRCASFQSADHCPTCGLRKSMYMTSDPEKKKLCGNRRCKDFGK